MATPISEHFSLEELTTTQHRQFDNTPDEAVLANLKDRLGPKLEEVHSLLGPMHVNSGYRSPQINAAVGGAPTSQHVQGLACDFVPLHHSFKEAAQMILDSDIEFDQMIFEFGTWLHISAAPEGREPRNQALMIGHWTNHHYRPLDLDVCP